MAVEIVDEDTHRVLAYVDALNRQGVKPHATSVDEFAERPGRGHGLRGMATFARQLALLQPGLLNPMASGETFSQYLERHGWVRLGANDSVEVTTMGRALLRALNVPAIEADDSAVVEVVLDPSNPFAYAQALNSLTTADDALLVEPYFRLDQLQDIAELTNITRVLLGPGVKPKDRKILAVGLAALEPERSLEVRAADNLHDRYLIPASEGPVLMLGASLGGIGKKVSTITPIGPEASRALRVAHEEMWTSAKVVEPSAPEVRGGSTLTAEFTMEVTPATGGDETVRD